MTRKLIIIGSGPAGYTAGIYSSRAELQPLLLAGEKPGGQLVNTSIVENWPGADEGIWGAELMLKMRQQAVKFGTIIKDEQAKKVDFSHRPFKVNNYEAEAVIIATGADNIRLNVPGEKELMGKGVAVCAVCDAAFYKDKIAAVVGGGDAACEDALALTKFANQVYLIVRRDILRASKIMQERVLKNPKIKILWRKEVKEILGQDKVEKIKLNNGEELKTDGLFLAIGHKPGSEIFKGQVEIDDKGYIKTGNNSKYLTMTSVEGVFAAGDVVDYRYRQAITASAMGCQAALEAEKYLNNLL